VFHFAYLIRTLQKFHSNFTLENNQDDLSVLFPAAEIQGNDDEYMNITIKQMPFANHGNSAKFAPIIFIGRYHGTK
jgi:hypothetical protein